MLQRIVTVYTGKKASPLDGKMVYRSGEGMVKQSDKEDFQSVLSRILGPGMKGKRFIVINDEAHHCYLPKEKKGRGRKDEETTEIEKTTNKRQFIVRLPQNLSFSPKDAHG